MKQHLILAAFCLAASLAQAAPVPSGQWQLRVTVRPSANNPPQQGNTTYNPRYFDGETYATQISTDTYRCFGRYAAGSRTFLGGGIPPVNEHRMLGRLRGTGGSIYLMGTGGVMGDATTFVPTFTRYDSDHSASNPVAVNSIDNQVVESFDWVDDDTMISTCYVSGQRNRLYLTDVVANPFALSKNITWNANGYVTTAVSTRIRNVRKGDVYSGYAYYGDAGQNTNPKFYAIDLATGVSTLLGNLGTLTGAGSFGLWTVIERGGYLYVQTTDNGIQVYNMTSATVLGSLYTTYTKAELDAVTGYTAQYYGLDVSADGKNILLGASLGNVYELQERVPIASGQWQRGRTLAPALYIGITPNSMFNPRYFDGEAYANQINVPCFGRYASGSITPEVVVDNSANLLFEHRMVASFRGAYSSTYMMGSSSVAVGATTTTFTRYNWDGSNPIQVTSPDALTVESFDWVNDHTIIFTCSKSPNTKRLYLADVVADPFSVTKNTTWNANGYVENTALTSRVRNARVGYVYSGYAYYSDAQSSNPTFWAINLATGVSTLLGNLGVLSNSASYGIWNVVERGGYLYVHTTGDGIQVYNMINATTLGSLFTTYTKAQLDACTGRGTTDQYYGLDVSPDLTTILIGTAFGTVYELEPALRLSISRSGTDVILSWPAYHTGVVVESSSSLPTGFADLSPQPAVVVVGDLNTATIPVDPAVPAFFRLRK